MSKKILIFGALGWLANKLADFLPNVILANRRVDIAKSKDVLSEIDLFKPDIVINAVGKIGRFDIDWSEDHSRRAYYRSNVLGPLNIAKICLNKGIYLAHLSCGSVFDGEPSSGEGWLEDDAPNPVNYYGETKVVAEVRLLKMKGDILIVRPGMLIDREPNRRSFISRIAIGQKVVDCLNSVTVVDDFLFAMAKLIEGRQVGIFNVVNPVPVRHQEILKWYREIVEPDHFCHLITVEQLSEQDLVKNGYSNSVLSHEKLKSIGIKLPNAPKAIKNCLRDYKYKN